MKKIVCIMIASIMLLACSSDDNDIGTSEVNNQEMFTDRDLEAEYNEDECTVIQLNNDSVECQDDHVNVSSSIVTIEDEGTYLVKGTLDDGMIIVNTDKNTKLRIILDNVNMNSSTSAPIYIKQADKVFVTLVNNNTLSNGGSFEAIDDNNIDSVVFSKDDLTFNGSGTLTINSSGGHGIVSKDDVVFTGGTYTINTSNHGITANNSVRIKDTSLKISAGKDGIQSDNDEDENLGFIYIESGTFDIVSEGDGISARAYMQINDGQFDIVCGGGYENGTTQTSENWGGFMGGRGHGMKPGQQSNETSSEDSESIKGLKAGQDLMIESGSFTIDSADDTLHANNDVIITGGTFELSSGDDGIHADNSLKINDGTINILESYEGIEGLTVEIAGGNIKLKASDDGLNSNGGNDTGGIGPRGKDVFSSEESDDSQDSYIKITGGDLYVNASGDGLDANGYIEMTDGYVVVVGPTQGDTATLDYDTSAEISGGTFIGTGASGMAQTFSSSSSQGVFAIQANGNAGTEIILEDTKGNEVISFSPKLSFNVVILSSPDIEKGESYTITVSTQSGTFEAN